MGCTIHGGRGQVGLRGSGFGVQENGIEDEFPSSCNANPGPYVLTLSNKNTDCGPNRKVGTHAMMAGHWAASCGLGGVLAICWQRKMLPIDAPISTRQKVVPRFSFP